MQLKLLEIVDIWEQESEQMGQLEMANNVVATNG
jgi:hypothetical protein